MKAKEWMQGAFADFKIRVICKFDYTFFMHLARDFVICAAFSWISLPFGVGLALGVNLAWEWQDGLHNDGFNLFDLLAGFLGVLCYFLIYKTFF